MANEIREDVRERTRIANDDPIIKELVSHLRLYGWALTAETSLRSYVLGNNYFSEAGEIPRVEYKNQ